MADHVDITLWIDRRWKNAIEKHLKGETLQEHLENVLDELCNQLPEQEYKRISAEIYAEDAAEREAREATRTYAAYHVTERGQEWYFKTSPGEELLVACKKLRGYVTAEKGTAPDKFIGMFFGGQPITAKEFDALTAVRMENTGKVRGVFDVNFDKREFSAVHTMDGWRTWAMRDVSRPSTMPQGRTLLRGMNSSPNYWSCWMVKRSPRRDTSPRGIFLSVMRSWWRKTVSSTSMWTQILMWTLPSEPSSSRTKTMTGSTSMPTTTSRRIDPATRWS